MASGVGAARGQRRVGTTSLDLDQRRTRASRRSRSSRRRCCKTGIKPCSFMMLRIMSVIKNIQTSGGVILSSIQQTGRTIRLAPALRIRREAPPRLHRARPRRKLRSRLGRAWESARAPQGGQHSASNIKIKTQTIAMLRGKRNSHKTLSNAVMDS